MVKNFKLNFGPLLLVFISMFMGCSSKPHQQEYITIGALFPLTGESADEGLRALNGLQLAKEEINERGGVLGKKLDFIVLNDRGDKEYIVQQYNKLKEKEVVAVIGSSYSAATAALAMAAEKDGIPIISPTASDPAITKGRPNVFRTILLDDYQAEAMEYFAYNTLNARTAVVLSNSNIETFRQTARAFAELFAARGGRIIAIEPYSTENEFPFILDKYAANPPDVIFCPGDFAPAAKLVDLAYDAGFTKTFMLGTDGWDGILAYVYHAAAMENVYYSTSFMFDDETAEVMLFVRHYFNAFSQMPLTGSAAAYTCVYILAEAIGKAGNTKPDDIAFAIHSNEFDTLMGRIKFDENNNPRTNVYIVQIKDGVYSTYSKLSL